MDQMIISLKQQLHREKERHRKFRRTVFIVCSQVLHARLHSRLHDGDNSCDRCNDALARLRELHVASKDEHA